MSIGELKKKSQVNQHNRMICAGLRMFFCILIPWAIKWMLMLLNFWQVKFTEKEWSYFNWHIYHVCFTTRCPLVALLCATVSLMNLWCTKWNTVSLYVCASVHVTYKSNGCLFHLTLGITTSAAIPIFVIHSNIKIARCLTTPGVNYLKHYRKHKSSVSFHFCMDDIFKSICGHMHLRSASVETMEEP